MISYESRKIVKEMGISVLGWSGHTRERGAQLVELIVKWRTGGMRVGIDWDV